MLRALVGWFCAACATGRRSAARQGIAVVRSSSAGAGVVSTDIQFEGMDGMFAAGSLSAPRARIALQQALHAVGRAGDSPAVRVWQDVFVKTAP